ncbi:MAG: hypothetical protein M1445_14410 [Bacteroidetes bacterium]|nr:hypothetical protein [Bacteroidota bacterium]MCL6102218.1 hypothetical protein [Bacteroidota bacterium]
MSYKSKIRQYMESKSYDLQEQIDQKEAEVLSILKSDNKNWPRIQELAEQANVLVNEWALLAELIGLDKKKIAKEFADHDLAAKELAEN